MPGNREEPEPPSRLRLGSRAWQGAAICALAAWAAACGSPAPQNEDSLSATAEGAERLSDSAFGNQAVPCSDGAEMARALLQITSRDLGREVKPRLMDWAVEPIRLRDGPGKVAVIVYSFSPRSDSDLLTTTEHFVVNQSCQVLSWSSASTSP